MLKVDETGSIVNKRTEERDFISQGMFRVRGAFVTLPGSAGLMLLGAIVPAFSDSGWSNMTTKL